jgi:hypothetical protein
VKVGQIRAAVVSHWGHRQPVTFRQRSCPKPNISPKLLTFHLGGINGFSGFCDSIEQC